MAEKRTGMTAARMSPTKAINSPDTGAFQHACMIDSFKECARQSRVLRSQDISKKFLCSL